MNDLVDFVKIKYPKMMFRDCELIAAVDLKVLLAAVVVGEGGNLMRVIWS